MGLVVYCKNYSCKFNKGLSEPKDFQFRRFYKPLGEDSVCHGECTLSEYNFIPVGISTTKVDYDLSLCGSYGGEEGLIESECLKTTCLWNEDKKCIRGEVLIDKLDIQRESYWCCRCFSNRSFSNHRDWTQMMNHDMTPKGGHIDDDYSEKMHHNDTVTKSFNTHTRQAGMKRSRK
jgi:hypothetical protein